MIAFIGDIYVNEGASISSFFFISSASNAKCKATVPLHTDIECLILIYLENLFSNLFIYDPFDDIHFIFQPSFTNFFFFRPIIGSCQ